MNPPVHICRTATGELVLFGDAKAHAIAFPSGHEIPNVLKKEIAAIEKLLADAKLPKEAPEPIPPAGPPSDDRSVRIIRQAPQRR
jgi:hypothetical protein